MPRTDTENIVAQVALEAIINEPSAYELETIVAVVENGRRADVGQMFQDQAEEILANRTNEAS